MVFATASGDKAEAATEIMNRHGAVEIEKISASGDPRSEAPIRRLRSAIFLSKLSRALRFIFHTTLPYNQTFSHLLNKLPRGCPLASYFGLKAHIGVDSKQGHVHSVCTSAASVADKHMLPDLLPRMCK